MRSALLFPCFAACALAVAAACQKDLSRPAIVDDSSGPHGSVGAGGGGGTDAGASDAAPSGRIATAPADVRGIAATSTDVYFLYLDPGDGGVDRDGAPVSGGGVLARVPRQGGVVQTVVTGGQSPRALSLVDDALYWIDDGAGGSSLVRFAAASLGSVLAGLTGTSVYVARSDVLVVATAGIGSVSIDRAPNADAGAVQNVGILQGEYTPVRLALDSSTVYLLASSAAGGSLFRLPLGGGPPEELWTGSTGTVRDLAIAGSTAYVAWDKGDASAIVAVPIPGGAAQTLVSPLAAPLQIAVDGSDLFFATAAGDVARAPIGGGTVTTLATGVGTPAALVVADAVYVGAGPNVLRIAR